MNNHQDLFSNVVPANNVFDENSIDFKLSGGPMHSEVLIASATMKKGINEGMPLPLYCTWYTVSKDSNEFIVIEHVSGACYQASIDDVGYRICVHAIPASDAEEYQGMPMFAEVGPLVMDEQILLKANNVIDNDELISFQIQLEKVQSQELLTQSSFKFPLKCHLILRRDHVKFQHQNDSIIIKDHRGNNINFLIVKHVNNKVEIVDDSNQTMAVFTMKNNIERDLFMLVYRNFKQNAEQFIIQQAAAQQLLADQQLNAISIEEDNFIELNNIKSIDNEIEDMPSKNVNTTQCSEQQEQIKLLTQQLESKIQQNQQLETNQGELEKQIQQFRHNYAKKIEEINQQSEEIRKFESEVNFYKQEVSLVQNENQKLKKKIGKMKNKLEVMTTNTLSNTPSEYSSTIDESISNTREICVQTNEDGYDDIQKQEALQTISMLEAERDKINGERNYFKKNLDSMKQDYDKLLKKQQQLEDKLPSINDNNTLSNMAQTSQILCGGCGAEILDHSFKSDQLVYTKSKRPATNNNNLIIQSEEVKRVQCHKKKKNIRSVYGQYGSKDNIEEKVQEVINLSQNNNHLNKSISLEGDHEQDMHQQNQLLYSDGMDQNIFESGKNILFEDEDTQLVNDFVQKMSITMTTHQQQQQIQHVFPEERLILLIEENTQMKQDMEAKLDKIQQYQYLVDEHKRALDDEIKKCNQYKQLLSQQKGFSLSIGGNNKQLDQMNKLINNLTVMIGEKDEEIQIQKNMNRELSRKFVESDKKSKDMI